MTISLDESLLVDRMAFDSSVLIPALDVGSKEPSAPLCRAIFKYLLRSNKTICIPVPTFAEHMLGGGTQRLGGIRQVEFLAFDAIAAEVLAKQIGMRSIKAIRRATGGSKMAIKYDAMIVATCIAHGAKCLVSADNQQTATCQAASFPVVHPSGLQSQQALPLP